MNERQAFKLAFLRRCAEHGLTADEIETLVDTGTIKQAEGTFMERIMSYLPLPAAGAIAGGPQGATLATVIPRVVEHATMPVLAGSAALGGAGGYLAGTATDSLSEQNPDEIKQRDIINRYSLATQRARTLNELAKHRQAMAGRKAHWRG